MREPITSKQIEHVEKMLKYHVDRRFTKHGEGAYVGPHEALGVITEEFHELVDAVKSNNSINIMSEMYDVAVACLVGLMSAKAIADAKQLEGA